MKDVEDLMLKLHQRNLELGEEKTKFEMKASRYQKLLTELQPLWMNASNDLQGRIQKAIDGTPQSWTGGAFSCGLTSKKAIKPAPIEENLSWSAKLARAITCGTRSSDVSDNAYTTVSAPQPSIRSPNDQHSSIVPSIVPAIVPHISISIDDKEEGSSADDREAVHDSGSDPKSPMSRMAILDESNPQPTMEISAAYWQEMLQIVREAEEMGKELEDALEEAQSAKADACNTLENELAAVKMEFVDYKTRMNDKFESLKQAPTAAENSSPGDKLMTNNDIKSNKNKSQDEGGQFAIYQQTLAWEEKLVETSLQTWERLEEKFSTALTKDLEFLRQKKKEHDSKFESELVSHVERKAMLFAKLNHETRNVREADIETIEEVDRIMTAKTKVDKWLVEEMQKITNIHEAQQVRYNEEMRRLKESFFIREQATEDQMRMLKQQWKVTEERLNGEVLRLQKNRSDLVEDLRASIAEKDRLIERMRDQDLMAASEHRDDKEIWIGIQAQLAAEHAKCEQEMKNTKRQLEEAEAREAKSSKLVDELREKMEKITAAEDVTASLAANERLSVTQKHEIESHRSALTAAHDQMETQKKELGGKIEKLEAELASRNAKLQTQGQLLQGTKKFSMQEDDAELLLALTKTDAEKRLSEQREDFEQALRNTEEKAEERLSVRLSEERDSLERALEQKMEISAAKRLTEQDKEKQEIESHRSALAAAQNQKETQKKELGVRIESLETELAAREAELETQGQLLQRTKEDAERRLSEQKEDLEQALKKTEVQTERRLSVQHVDDMEEVKKRFSEEWDSLVRTLEQTKEKEAKRLSHQEEESAEILAHTEARAEKRLLEEREKLQKTHQQEMKMEIQEIERTSRKSKEAFATELTAEFQRTVQRLLLAS